MRSQGENPLKSLTNPPDTAKSFVLHPTWARVFLPSLMYLFFASQRPFQDFINNSPAFIAIAQEALNATHPNISHKVIAGDAIVTTVSSTCIFGTHDLKRYPTKQAFDRLKSKRSLIASEALKLVKKYFKADNFIDKSEDVKKHVWWALRPDGLAYQACPTPIDCPPDRTSPLYVVSDSGLFELFFTLNEYFSSPRMGGINHSLLSVS